MRREYEQHIVRSGKFSVNANKQVYFAHGNLYYVASENEFYMHENQYDCLNNTSGNLITGAARSTQSLPIDLFPWACNGINNGKKYMPWEYSSNNNDYYQSAIAGTNYDWGYAWSQKVGGEWRTWTHDELIYLFSNRSGNRFAKCMVNGQAGIMLFPDGYDNTFGFVNVNNGSSVWSGNTLTLSDFAAVEDAGCVFLPTANQFSRSRQALISTTYGSYWESTKQSNAAGYSFNFADTSVNPANGASDNASRCAVRLIIDC